MPVQIREGRVKSISAKAAGELKQDGWVFLDVRPPPEIEKVCMPCLVLLSPRRLLIVYYTALTPHSLPIDATQQSMRASAHIIMHPKGTMPHAGGSGWSH